MTISLSFLAVAFVCGGCKSGNPQEAPPKHAGHQHGEGHQHERGEKNCGCGGNTAVHPAPAEGEAAAPMAFAEAPKTGTKARCAVADKTFTVADDTTRSEHKGKHYVFCCGGCKDTFDANPDSFTGR
jgi:hypothetical protein